MYIHVQFEVKVIYQSEKMLLPCANSVEKLNLQLK